MRQEFGNFLRHLYEEPKDISDTRRKLYVRKLPSRYKPIIKKAEFMVGTASFSQEIVSDFAEGEVTDFINQKMANGVVVDLASADYPYISTMAATAKAKCYIGVDIHFNDDYKTLGSTEVINIQDDMLTFVAQQANESVDVYVISGVSEIKGTTAEYMSLLIKEIFRTLRPGGLLIFGQNFPTHNIRWQKTAADLGLEKVTVHPQPKISTVFMKPGNSKK